MSESQLCPQCGGEIPGGAPAGLCPKCLMLAGLESRPPVDPSTAATQPPPSSASTGFVPPTVEEVAAKFPQLEVLELLGRGGMGAVYKARQRELDRLVAVKILPPEVSRDPAFAERFTREARALARLNHPNIVGVYDFGKTPSSAAPLPEGDARSVPLFYFIMEYVDGVNLRQAIQAGQMDSKQALAIVPQICDALQFAHDEGVVHRDIKPENILIDKRGRVKIADFGLAKLLGQESVDHGLTATQQVMGTLRYMAPEQMEGTKTVDHRADIYSLGVVFYELLTGELPIGRFAPPSKMVEIDVRLDEVVLRALEKKPEQRYQHASEVRTDIDNIASGSGASASRATAAVESTLPAWWLRQSHATQRAVRGLLIALFAIGSVAFLYCHQGADQFPGRGKHTYFKIGAWQPWYSSEWEDGSGGSSTLNMYSISSLFGVLAIVSLVLLVKLVLAERHRRDPAELSVHGARTAKTAPDRSSDASATATATAAGSAGSDRGFVATIATALISAWIALLISTNGDKLPFDLRTSPPIIFGIHLLFPLVAAALAAGVFTLIRPRPTEPFLDRIVRSAPMLLGWHLLMFSIAMFTCGYYDLEWDRVTFARPNVGVAELHPHEEIAYQVQPFDSWAGKLAAGTAGVGLFALLLTLGTPPRLRARAAVLVLVGLFTLGAVAEYMVLRPPKTITFTPEQYRAFDPDHANGSTYEQFVRESNAEFETFVTYPSDARARAEHASFKTELSKVVVHHYFRDEVAWFLLPGGLILLCGLLTWRQAAAAEEPAAGPQLAPLAAIATFVGVVGPLVCVPGIIVAFLMLDQKETLWGNQPSMAFTIGLVGMMVWIGISLLAMSVLGAAAVGQIRRSSGKFYGLCLALLEALFCPAIVLYCVAFFVLALVLAALPRPENAGMALFPPLFAVMVIVIVTVAFIYWRLLKRFTTSRKELDVMALDKPRAVSPSASNQSGAFGTISLWTSISGLVAPLLLAGIVLEKSLGVSEAYFYLCFALGIVLEFVAAGFGIAARRSPSGKAGLSVSVFALALFAFLLGYALLPSEKLPVMSEQSRPPDEVTAPAASAASEEVRATPALSSRTSPNPFGLHPAKQVPPTSNELFLVYDELPKEFKNGLTGGFAERIKALDTRIYAIDFDDGPADFWMQVKETGQQTFPVRLPSGNVSETWRVPKAKAHILMWIQPRQSAGMSEWVRGALAGMQPGCLLGIDVDGKEVARIPCDTPVGGVNKVVPHPLFAWEYREMHPVDSGFDAEMASQAILYIGRKSMAQGLTNSCQLGLMYRPDRQKKASER